jgi:hypothetical protein
MANSVRQSQFAQVANQAQTSVSSSYAVTASFLTGNITSASYAQTASFLIGTITSASYAITASFSFSSLTSSYINGGTF